MSRLKLSLLSLIPGLLCCGCAGSLWTAQKSDTRSLDELASQPVVEKVEPPSRQPERQPLAAESLPPFPTVLPGPVPAPVRVAPVDLKISRLLTDASRPPPAAVEIELKEVPPVESGNKEPVATATVTPTGASVPVSTTLPDTDKGANAEILAEKKESETEKDKDKEEETYEKGAWRRLAAEARSQLAVETKRDKPNGREGQVLEITSRLLHLIGNDPQQAAQEIADLNEDEREFWKHQLYALAVALDAGGKHAENRRAALSLRELRSAMDHLQNLSTLDIRHMAICEKVESYGRYTPFKTGSFKPGQEFLLYVEIDNFAVEEVGDRFRTELRAEYTLTNAEGHRIQAQLPPTSEECRNRRRDYFIAYTLSVPRDLRPGTYTLQLTVEDVVGRKSSQGTIELRVR